MSLAKELFAALNVDETLYTDTVMYLCDANKKALLDLQESSGEDLSSDIENIGKIYESVAKSLEDNPFSSRLLQFLKDKGISEIEIEGYIAIISDPSFNKVADAIQEGQMAVALEIGDLIEAVADTKLTNNVMH